VQTSLSSVTPEFNRHNAAISNLVPGKTVSDIDFCQGENVPTL
jgi:hypothetical protein